MAGEWAAAVATPPAVGVGAPFFPDNRVAVEIMVITSANVDGTGLAWVDITDRVIYADWSEGDTAGAESRWGLGQLNIECFDLYALVGDFISHVSTRPGSGSLIRVSMISDAGTWHPQFTGIIDAFTQDDKMGPVTWQITAYDILYRAAGHNNLSPDYEITAGTWQLYQIIQLVLQADPQFLDYPFNYDMLTPTGHPAGAFTITRGSSLLALIHRLADSYSRRVWGGRNGRVYVRPWNNTELSRVTTIVDVADPGNPATVYGQIQWSSSTARMCSLLHCAGLDAPDSSSYTPTSLDMIQKNGWREDAPGWPKLDLLYANHSQGEAIVLGAAARFADELSAPVIDIDTEYNGFSNDVVHHLRFAGVSHGLRFVRTSTGFVYDCMILGHRHRIENFHSHPRWTASYYPKILEINASLDEPEQQ
jgi:hypothetical protein